MEKKETYHILMEGMEFHAPIGCYEMERRSGCHIMADLDIELRQGRVAESDRVKDTVSYLDVYRLVSGIMSEPRNTLENLAGCVIDSVRKAYPTVTHARCRVRKMAPPLGGKTASVAVEMEG